LGYLIHFSASELFGVRSPALIERVLWVSSSESRLMDRPRRGAKGRRLLEANR
jgi:hypothetical protein